MHRMTRPDHLPPPRWRMLTEGMSVGARAWRAVGPLGERGPEDGPRAMVLPGFLATDRTTLGLQRALAAAGYRVTGWGMGLIGAPGRTASTASPTGWSVTPPAGPRCLSAGAWAACSRARWPRRVPISSNA
jgi:hypothetical protein